MNNKGQVLVIFVIFLPIFILIVSIMVDYGMLSLSKRNVSNNTYDAVEYYLENIEDSDVKNNTIKLLESNLDDITIDIIDNDDYVKIKVKKTYKSLYSIITDNSFIVEYKGFKDSKKIIKG